MAELGHSADPTALVPGNAAAIRETEAALIQYGDLLHEAGSGLKRIDTTDGWSGAAGDAFRHVFHGQPSRWLQAGDAFHAAASALDDYAATMTWAQQQAGVAAGMWSAGAANHQAAQDTLASARGQLVRAGEAAASAIGKARDLAPPKPGFWSKVGLFLSGAAHDAEQVGEGAVDTLASLANAAAHDPGDMAAVAGGLALAGVSGAGDGLGLVLDATGVGAVAGLPLNAVSTAGVVAGAGIATAGAAGIARDAAGQDHVSLMRSDSASAGGRAGGSEPPKTKQEITDQAKNLGYDRRVAPQRAPFNSHGQPVYTDGKNYITPDVDGHNVSNGWKLMNRRGNRIGTYTWDLTRVKD